MKTPWMNYKKMEGITSTPKNCIRSSKVRIKSLFQKRDFRQINIFNSSGIQVQSITRRFKGNDIEDSANGNESGRLAQNDYFYESPAYTDADQCTQADRAVENQNDDTITNSPDLRINPVHDASSESSNDPALDPTNSSESNISDESYPTFDHEEMNESDVPDDTDEFYMEGENRNKSGQLAQNDRFCESPAYTDADLFTQDNPAADDQNDDKITDSPDLRINPVHDASSESSIDPALDPTNSSESNISDESHKTFDYEEMNESDVPDDKEEFHMNGENGNESSQVTQNDHVYKSPAYTDADPVTQDDRGANTQNDDNVTDSTDVRINSVHAASSESSIGPALDPTNFSESNISDGRHKTFDHEEMNESDVPDDKEEFHMNADQFTHDDTITNSPDLRINPVHAASPESSIDPTLDPTNSTASNISDESHKTFDYEEMNEKDVPDDTEAFHMNGKNRNENGQLAQNDNKITDSTDVRINSVHDASSEPSIDPTLDPTNSSESNISDESYTTFDHEEMNENVHDSFKSGEINHNSVPAPHFINIRVPVVVGEYKLECCLEEAVTFKEKVRRIKEISNKVVLTNCKFVPTQLSQVLDNGTCKALEGYLFIEGSIHQSIEYVADGTAEFPMNGKLCSMKRNSPFSITVKIDDFLHPPVFGSNAQTTFEFLDQNNTQIPQLNTKLFHSTIYYPEQPYCQMISSKIHQSVCLANTIYASNNHLNQSVVVPKKYQLDQKIVVEVFVHLLQIQHVRVKSDDK